MRIDQIKDQLFSANDRLLSATDRIFSVKIVYYRPGSYSISYDRIPKARSYTLFFVIVYFTTQSLQSNYFRNQSRRKNTRMPGGCAQNWTPHRKSHLKTPLNAEKYKLYYIVYIINPSSNEKCVSLPVYQHLRPSILNVEAPDGLFQQRLQ